MLTIQVPVESFDDILANVQQITAATIPVEHLVVYELGDNIYKLYVGGGPPYAWQLSFQKYLNKPTPQGRFRMTQTAFTKQQYEIAMTVGFDLSHKKTPSYLTKTIPL